MTLQRLNWITSQKTLRGKEYFLGVKTQTWGSYQHSGLAAAEAVEQRLAADVLVEERHGRAQLGQGQPRKHEGGLIPHEKRHGVPSCVPAQRTQRVGAFVADSVDVTVRVSLLFKHNEGSVRTFSSLLQESIQNKEERFPPPPPRVGQ